MIHTISPRAMREMEARFLRDAGYPGLLLMERAALALHGALAEMAAPGAAVLFLCGGGNNGGDGLALARLWRESGGQALVYLSAPQESLPPDAALNARLLEGWRVPVSVHPDPAAWVLPAGTAVVVDALLGTGLDREVSAPLAALMERVNESGLPVLSVDIPSGIDGETGQVRGAAIRATRTVTFHRPKPGHYLFPGRAYTGRLTVSGIGIPPDWDEATGHTLLEATDLLSMLPRRALDAHKGDFGHGLILAGSLGMAGAAALCAMAAVRSGAGRITIACPESILPILQTLVPAAMAVGLPEEEGQLAPQAAQRIAALLPGKTALALGPGLGRGEGVGRALVPALSSPLPKVIDADALYALGRAASLPERSLLTPHPGEMARLSGLTVEGVTADPVETARAFVAERDAVLLLKGATTVLARRGEIALNVSGTPAMAKGGSGDVLTGLLLALLCQGLPRWRAARTGALIHGLAGEAAARETGTRGMSPEDLAQKLPQTLRRYGEEGGQDGEAAE